MERPRGVSIKRERRQDRREDQRDRKRQRRAIQGGSREGGTPGSPSLTGLSTSSPSTTAGQGGGDFGSGGSNRQTVPQLQDSPDYRPGTDFGKSFSSLSWPMIRDNPTAMTRAYMMDMGLDPMAGGGATVLFDSLAQYIPLLHVLSQTQGGISTTGDAALLDYAKMFLDQMTTPGAGVPNLGANIFSAGPDSGLSKIINDPTLDAAGQANELLRYLGAAIGMMDSGPVGRAVGNASLLQAQNYIAQQARNPTSGQTFTDFLRNTDLDEWLNG